ncbi:MAG: biotin/lipoate A/B protein ligase family protein [archaeon]
MRWRLIDDTAHDAATNMGIDEAISESVSTGQSPPTIRFYAWEPSAVSIGYFQGLSNEVDMEACEKAGVDVVRRRTGGGAVYHDRDGEITYSIVGPLSLFPSDIIGSYRMICGHVVDALRLLDIPAEFAPINDIQVEGKKISGSAQTRRNGVLLQHGTLLLDVDVDRMFSLLRVGKEKIADKLIKSVKKRVTSIQDFGVFSKDDVRNALKEAFSKGRDISAGSMTEEELALAKRLAQERYKSDAWTAMR